MEALRSATSNVGKYLGDPTIGCLAAGCDASLVILEADPLQDIGNTCRVKSVVVRGSYLDGAARQAMLTRCCQF
jgi:imidazolonepropionase-like amidohydrolase